MLIASVTTIKANSFAFKVVFGFNSKAQSFQLEVENQKIKIFDQFKIQEERSQMDHLKVVKEPCYFCFVKHQLTIVMS